VIAAGTVADLLAGGSSGDLRVRVPDPAAARQLLEQAGYQVSSLGDAWRVGGVTDPGQLTRLLSQAGHYLTELTPIGTDLESVFLDLTKDQPPATGDQP
jgi:ABC-2 type transport system ATP-binding protein